VHFFPWIRLVPTHQVVFISLYGGNRCPEVMRNSTGLLYPLPLLPAASLENKLMVIMFCLITIHMPRCDSLNIIFCKTTQISVFFAFLKIKEQTNLRLPLDVEKLSIWWEPMPWSDEEFHQVLTILEHIWYVNGVTKILLTFYCPFWAEENRTLNCLSNLPFHSEDSRRVSLSNEGLVWGCTTL